MYSFAHTSGDVNDTFVFGTNLCIVSRASNSSMICGRIYDILTGDYSVSDEIQFIPRHGQGTHGDVELQFPQTPR
jgi:hypothetical protein